MTNRPRSEFVWRRLAMYSVITLIIQALLGMSLWSTMYGPGPLSLLFLIPMTNIGYLWLLQNAINFKLWPIAILIGSLFMFLVIAAIGESIYQLKRVA